MSAAVQQKSAKRGEIAIAIIGLVGVLVTGILSNWDKIFQKQNVVQATYSGYRPTGNFETELRYFIDVSGTRVAVESMQRQLLLAAKANAISENPSEANEVNEIIAIIEQESIQTDDVIRELLLIYQRHFTIAEIQELNKFYSTETMQGMIRKTPLLAQDSAPILTKMASEYIERVNDRITKSLENE